MQRKCPDVGLVCYVTVFGKLLSRGAVPFRVPTCSVYVPGVAINSRELLFSPCLEFSYMSQLCDLGQMVVSTVSFVTCPFSVSHAANVFVLESTT